MSSSWRAACSTLHLAPTRIFDGDAAIGQAAVLPQVKRGAASASSAFEDLSRGAFADLLGGALVFDLAAAEATHSSPTPRRAGATGAAASAYFALEVARLDVALLHPAALPVALPSAARAWWVPLAPAAGDAAYVAGGPRPPAEEAPAFALLRHRQLAVLHALGLALGVLAPQAPAPRRVRAWARLRSAQLDDHQTGIHSHADGGGGGSALTPRFPVIASLRPAAGASPSSALLVQLECAVVGPSGALEVAELDVTAGMLQVQLTDAVADEVVSTYGRWMPLLASSCVALAAEASDFARGRVASSGAASSGAADTAGAAVASLSRLRLGEVTIELSLCAAKPDSTPLFLAVDRMPVVLGAVSLSNVAAAPAALARGLLASYIADAILRSPVLLGSLDLLGNPTSFVRSVAAGVHDVFAMPLRAPSLLAGVGLGWASLAGHVTEGALHSIAAFAVSVSRNVDRLSSGEGREAPTSALARAAAAKRPLAASAQVADGNGAARSNPVAEGGADRWTWAMPQDSPTVPAAPLLGVPPSEGGGLVDALAGPAEPSAAAGAEDAAEVSGLRASLVDGVAGLGRGLLGAVSDVAHASTSALLSGRSAGSILAGLGRAATGAVTKPLAGALELVAHASTSAMLAVQVTPQLSHLSGRAWAQTARSGPPAPALERARALLGEVAALCPCSVQHERLWLAVSARDGRLVFLRHGGGFREAHPVPWLPAVLLCASVGHGGGPATTDGAEELVLVVEVGGEAAAVAPPAESAHAGAGTAAAAPPTPLEGASATTMAVVSVGPSPLLLAVAAAAVSATAAAPAVAAEPAPAPAPAAYNPFARTPHASRATLVVAVPSGRRAKLASALRAAV